LPAKQCRGDRPRAGIAPSPVRWLGDHGQSRPGAGPCRPAGRWAALALLDRALPDRLQLPCDLRVVVGQSGDDLRYPVRSCTPVSQRRDGRTSSSCRRQTNLLAPREQSVRRASPFVFPQVYRCYLKTLCKSPCGHPEPQRLQVGPRPRGHERNPDWTPFRGLSYRVYHNQPAPAHHVQSDCNLKHGLHQKRLLRICTLHGVRRNLQQADWRHLRHPLRSALPMILRAPWA